MSVRREYARLPVVPSWGPMPDARHFKYKDQVLVRFHSGWYTLGTVIRQKNHWKLGPEELLYLYYRDPRHSHSRLLGGQGCDCPEKGGHKANCELITSGMRAQKPVQVPTTPPLLLPPAQVYVPMAGQAHPTANTTPLMGPFKKRKVGLRVRRIP